MLSGGNIDPLLLAKLLRHGLTVVGRYLAFRCRLPDRPWIAGQALADLADLGANVLEVAHERLASRLHVDEAEVVLQLETRGPRALRGSDRRAARRGLHAGLRLS